MHAGKGRCMGECNVRALHRWPLLVQEAEQHIQSNKTWSLWCFFLLRMDMTSENQRKLVGQIWDPHQESEVFWQQGQRELSIISIEMVIKTCEQIDHGWWCILRRDDQAPILVVPQCKESWMLNDWPIAVWVEWLWPSFVWQEEIGDMDKNCTLNNFV